MRISNCLNPQRVFNPYLGEFIHVPCGKCDSCRNIRAYSWETRLKQEFDNHRYCVFFTLTYDDDCLPCFVKLNDDTLVSKPRLFRYITNQREIKERIFHDGLFISRKDIDLSDQKDLAYFEKYNTFCYPSVDDIQRFVKRLRYNINELFKDIETEEEESSKDNRRIKYYIVSELGPVTHRVHYHGSLFFDSRRIAEQIVPLIDKSWLLCDSKCKDVQFCGRESFSYVTKYINSLIDLPSVYRLHSTRPIALFSRRPFIGHGWLSKEQIRQVLDSSKVCVPYLNSQTKKVTLTRINNSFERRYFPRIFGFSLFNDSVGTCLYKLVSETGKSKWIEFLQCVRALSYSPCFAGECIRLVNTRIVQYCDRFHISIGSDDYEKRFLSCWHRIFSVSRMVMKQAEYFGISIDYYIKQIYSYYCNVDAYNLNNMYNFMVDYTDNPKLNRSPRDLECFFPNSCLDYDRKLRATDDYRAMNSIHSKIAKDMRNNKERKAHKRAKELHKSIREY